MKGRFPLALGGASFRRFSAALGLISLALGTTGCGTENCPPPGIKYVTQKVDHDVQVPCKVDIPTRPDPVVVKAGDDAYALNLRYKAALEQWGGGGKSYANLAEAAITACQKAGATQH